MSHSFASWDKAGASRKIRLARFLAHVDEVAADLLASDGPYGLELAVGLPDGVAADG